MELLTCLPTYVVEVDSTNSFKRILDWFRSDQDISYDWESEFKAETEIYFN
jgi:hypothetical protein